MINSDVDEKILGKLGVAGANGLTASALLGRKPSSDLKAALAVLVENGMVVNLGSKTRPRYVASQFYNPLEMAYDAVLAKATPGKASIYLTKELRHGCAGVVADKVGEAIRQLVREKKLIPVKRGQGSYYLHVDSIRSLVDFSEAMDRTSPSKDSSAFPEEKVHAAYRDLVREKRFADVMISDLVIRSCIHADVLGPWLIEQSRAGKVAPTTGDWALASEAERAAAIDIQGEPQLRVRFL